MSKGYVYVLSNPSMPGLVKIGRTTRDVQQRANELWQTGVPTPFFIEHYQLFPNCIEAEWELHEVFEDFRTEESREFFEVSADDVIEQIDCMIFRSLKAIVHEYRQDFSVADSDESLVIKMVGTRAEEMGLRLPMLAASTLNKSNDELWAEVQKTEKRLADMDADDGGRHE